MRRSLLMLTCLVSLLCLPLRCGDAQQPRPLLPDLGHPLLKNLQGWWRAWPGFTGGTLWYDLVGRQHGTLSNMGFSATSGWHVTDRRGGSWAVAFDGTDDQGIIADTPALRMDLADRFTWAFWMKTTYGGGTTLQCLIKYDANFTGFYLQMNSGHFGCAFYQASSATTMGRWSTVTQSDGAWHRVGCTYDGSGTDSGFSLYLDGQVVATTAQGAASQTGSVLSTAVVTLLPGSSGPAAALDDLRFWRRALTSQEMAAVYQQSLLGDPDLFPPLAPLGMPLAGGTPGSFFQFFGR